MFKYSEAYHSIFTTTAIVINVLTANKKTPASKYARVCYFVEQTSSL